MAKAFNVESALSAAGVDVGVAKAALVKLDEAFGGEAGDIPEGALIRWADEHFNGPKAQRFFVELGRLWEDEHVATLPPERKWEREPGAAEEKKRRNQEAWEKRHGK
jgi:hypothetical protein